MSHYINIYALITYFDKKWDARSSPTKNKLSKSITNIGHRTGSGSGIKWCSTCSMC
jgi:hypothetical protein